MKQLNKHLKGREVLLQAEIYIWRMKTKRIVTIEEITFLRDFLSPKSPSECDGHTWIGIFYYSVEWFAR